MHLLLTYSSIAHSSFEFHVFFDVIVCLILYLYFQGYISNFFASVFSFKALLIAEEAMMISSLFFFRN